MIPMFECDLPPYQAHDLKVMATLQGFMVY